MNKLLGQGLVQAELLSNKFNGLFVSFRTGSQSCRIARQQMYEKEHAYRHNKHCRKHAQYTFDKIAQHFVLSISG